MKTRVVILGGGPGGYAAAMRAVQLGADVTLIERDTIGGVCLNWGCVPTKTMMFTAHLLRQLRKAQEYGLETNGPVQLDLQRLMARKQKIVWTQLNGMLLLLEQHGIRYLKGQGSLQGPGMVVLEQEDGQRLEVPWDRLIIATGSEPMGLPSLPCDGRRVLSTNDVVSIRELPESVLIIGGGVVGSEFAFLLDGLGSKVVVVEALSRMLPIAAVEEDCSKVLMQEMKKNKIAFHLNRTVEKVTDRGGKWEVIIGCPSCTEGLREKDKAPITVEVDKILVCTGRKPNTENIGIENLGIELDRAGCVIADERMKTSAPFVYAVGDVLGPSRMMLAHVAAAEGVVAAENAMGKEHIMDYAAVPSAIFTMPEVGCVGLTEAQARDKGFDVQSHSTLFRNVGKSHVVDEISGMAKIVSDEKTGVILGIHIVGPNAAELIAEGVLAVKVGCTVKDLAQTVHAHPTLAEVLSEAVSKS